MKRVIVWLSVILLGCYYMVSPRSVGDRHDLVSLLKEETVAFVDRSKSDDSVSYVPYCTGVWITRNHVLTARHCVTASNETLDGLIDQNIPVDLTQVDMEYVTESDIANVKPRDIVARRAKTVAVDDYQDLAIVEVNPGTIPEHPIADIAREGPADGEEVHIIGHTMMMYWTYLRGYVSATREPIYDVTGNATKAIQVASPAYMGNSGGGAFNDDGELVGLMSWISTQTPEMGFFLHRDEITAFIANSRLRP